MNSFKGVILDVDGTLVDSNDAHARSWVDALKEQGVAISFDKVRPLIGMGGDKLLPRVSGISEESAQGQAITIRRKEIFKERYLPSLRSTPGARDLLRHLKDRGARLVVASSAKKDELEGLLHVCGADGLIDDQISSNDADHSKPDPDIVRAALDNLGMPPHEVVMLGDTPYDIEAAQRTGVGVIALRSGGWNDEDLVGALAVYDDPADLLIRLDSSPLK